MKLSRIVKIPLTYVACLMLAFATPMTVFAEEASPESEQTETAPAQPVAPEPASPIEPEPAAPVAPDAPKPADPKPPEPPETYTFDSSTQKWNSNKWQWDAASGKYIPAPVLVEVKDSVKPAQNGTSSTSTTNTAIANALNSIAVSGNAGVKNNTTGGSAVTGDANASATIINNVNSTLSNSNNKEAANFVMDIMGDVNGDIMLEPMLLKAMLEANAAQNQSGTSTVNATNNTSVNNNVDLNAVSGNAEVSGNTSAGSATSGSANAVANVMNMVNSMIAANQSFDGTINIYGNLNGDILIAPDFLAQMLANNGIPASANGATKLNAKDTQEIVNNVSLAAESGAALVGNNTNGGSATSGTADTNLVIFNMTGHEIVAANSLLVFINVLGSWVGVIVDAPVGATSAALADGVTKNDVQPSMIVDATNDAKITNNINLAAQTGSASVTNNTSAGNATTGNATASANIANISNSSMGLTGWFGRLFINVFGTWNGSFGIDTAAGSAPVKMYTEDTSAPQVIKFVPRTESVQKAAVQRIKIVTPAQQTTDIPEAKQASTNTTGVLAANDTKSDTPSQQDYINARKQINIPIVAASVVLIIGSGYVLRRFLF